MILVHAAWGSRFYVFGTGRLILSRCSTHRVDWQEGPRVFNTVPPWTTNAVPGFNGHFWDPDVAMDG